MIVTKPKILVSLLSFPAISFFAFYVWAQSLTNDPNAGAFGFALIQYAIIYGATIACNSTTIWAIITTISGGLVIYGVMKRSVYTFILMNISLFVIFCLPVFLAITGVTRFCLSFLT
ncbi:MAG: hypothetical protein P8K27_03975 [Gammaproteobacteria bacterium]|nr:hypothetical protein [Gammaproteobacteria bacterium]